MHSEPGFTFHWSLVATGRAFGQNCSHAPVKVQSWYFDTMVGTSKPLNKGADDVKFGRTLRVVV